VSGWLIPLAYLDFLLRAGALIGGFYLVTTGLSLASKVIDAASVVEPVKPVESVQARPSPSPTVQPSVQVAPSPVIVESVAPAPQVMPSLSPMAIEVQRWDVQTVAGWVSFCSQTRGGVGYTANDQNICAALRELGR